MLFHRSLSRLLGASLLLLTVLLTTLPAPRAAAAGDTWCPPQSYGVCSTNAFLDFWHANGGLDSIGYPVDPPRRTPQGLIFQVYERAIMEWHPELPAAYQVSLARLGAILVDSNPTLKSRSTQAPVPCTDYCTTFTETKHTLRGVFLNAWRTNGGLAVYGYPLTEEIREVNANGVEYTVQYFERNRFEYHDDSLPPYNVQLGRLGAEYLTATAATLKGWPVVGVPNYAAAVTPPPPSSDQAIIDTATGLVRSVPEMRYIADNLAAKNVRTAFGTLPQGVDGSYNLRANTITFNAEFRAMDPHDLGAVLGHEGQHAFDILTYGAPRTSNDCLALEYRGFLSEATLWQAWYGPRGKANPVNDFERGENAILADVLYNNGARLKAFIASAYAEECAARVAPSDQAVSVIPATTEGLPTLVATLIPQAGAQLAQFASDTDVAAFTTAEPVPAWTVR